MRRVQNDLRKKDEEIKELTSKKKQAEASRMLVDECDKLHEERKEKEDGIDKLTSDLKNNPKLAQQLKQYVEESGILEDEYKRLKDEEIKALKSELENARQEEQQRVQEAGILEEECKKLQNEVKEKEEIIEKLSSELEDERKRGQKLEQQISESEIVQEELKRLTPA